MENNHAAGKPAEKYPTELGMVSSNSNPDASDLSVADGEAMGFRVFGHKKNYLYYPRPMMSKQMDEMGMSIYQNRICESQEEIENRERLAAEEFRKEVEKRQEIIRARIHDFEENFINRSGTCIGILGNDGVLLATYNRIARSKTKRKIGVDIYQLNEDVGCCIIGNASDAQRLIKGLSKSVKSYESGDSPDCSLILGRDFDLKKSLGRQYFHPEGWPERKPYRIGIIFMGWNDLIGHHLTRADYEKHAGNLRTASIGENWAAVSSYLQEAYKDGETTLEDAKLLAIKAFDINLNNVELTSNYIQIATLKNDRTSKKTKIEIMQPEDVDAVIAAYKKGECRTKYKNRSAQVAPEPLRKRKKHF